MKQSAGTRLTNREIWTLGRCRFKHFLVLYTGTTHDKFSASSLTLAEPFTRIFGIESWTGQYSEQVRLISQPGERICLLKTKLLFGSFQPEPVPLLSFPWLTCPRFAFTATRDVLNFSSMDPTVEPLVRTYSPHLLPRFQSFRYHSRVSRPTSPPNASHARQQHAYWWVCVLSGMERVSRVIIMSAFRAKPYTTVQAFFLRQIIGLMKPARCGVQWSVRYSLKDIRYCIPYD